MKKSRKLIAQDAMGSVIQDTWKPENAAEMLEVLRLTFGSRPESWTFEDELEELRAKVDSALTELGWPPSHTRIAYSCGNQWRLIQKPEEVGENEQFAWSYYWIKKAAPPLSKPYWLGRIAYSLRSLSNTSRGSLHIFREAMKIGFFLDQIDLRDVALKSATEGKAIAKGRQRAAESVKRQNAKKREKRFAELERLIPSIGLNAAAKHLDARGLGDWQAIKKQWTRHQRKIGDT